MKLIQNLCLAAALIGSTAVSANPWPVSDSGLVSVYPGQAAQLNVVNLGAANTSCQLKLSLIDADGVELPSPLLATIPSGGSLPLVGPFVSAPVTLRAHIDYSPQIIAQAQAGFRDPLAGCYNLIPTLEVIDASGTRVVVTNFVGMPSNLSGEKQSNLTICHKPGTPAEHNLSIPAAALKGHLGHGDRLGGC